MEINKPNLKFQDISIAPMHTAEHILNSCMVRHFHCNRAFSTHIEKKKSKCDYRLEAAPTEQDMQEIERQVNNVIAKHIDITTCICSIDELPNTIDVSKLPDSSIKTVRLVEIGEYDICLCIGEHVRNTSEIGIFKIISFDFEDSRLRIRFKLEY